MFRWLWRSAPEPKQEAQGVESVTPMVEDAGPPPVHRLVYGYPSDQRDLANTNSNTVYQPTASGRVESALYGSIRTSSFGGRLLPSFHEGIDIASLDRDRRGHPRDKIYAITDGHVAYVNRRAGNSNYGIYIVLVHADEVGEIYSLYAHLAKASSSLKVGQAVERGEVIGVMGHTASTGIPIQRAHLHLEVGVINNLNFAQWYRAQKKVPDHGNYHGHNMTGISPLAIYGGSETNLQFSMHEYLSTLPPAFTLVVKLDHAMDYFKRYPRLWIGESVDSGPVVLEASEGGVLLRGRTATAEEADQLGTQRVSVLEANEELLGRNGLRHVVHRNGKWILGKNGEAWLDILML